jgi:hypothetical protein
LHPKYQKTALEIIELHKTQVGTWKNANNALTARRLLLLADAALFYYCKHDLWFAPDNKKEEDNLKLAIYMWLSDRTPWDDFYKYDPVRWLDP